MTPFTRKGLAPIVLSGLALGFSSISQTLKGVDLDHLEAQQADRQLSDFIRNTQSLTYTNWFSRQIFFQHYNNWVKEVMFSSSLAETIENDQFIKIVAMGEGAIPFIIEELKRQPTYLVLALPLIFKIDICAGNNLNLEDTSKKWLRFLEA